MSRPVSAHLRAFIKDPKGVAALLPTSALAVEQIATKVDPLAARLLIEYGPGSGVLTRRLLATLRSGGRLLAIERDPGLAARLRGTLDDPRLTVVHDSAQSLPEILDRLALGPADHVLSGIPFFWLAPDTARQIVEETHGALRAGGSFVTYQVFYQRRRHLRVHLERCFSNLSCELALRNLPPYRICVAVK